MSLLTSFTRPSHIQYINMLGSALAITNAPAAETEVAAVRWRALVDLRPYSQIRLMVNVGTAGSAGTVLRLQWCATAGGTYAEFQATNSPSVPIETINTLADSGWVAIPATAKTGDVFLRLATAGGNAGTSPVLSNAYAVLR